MADFIVRLDVDLPPEVQKRIAGAIQGAVMNELGRIDLTVKGKAAHEALSFVPQQGWRGKWLRALVDLKEGNGFLTTAGNVNLIVQEQKAGG
jgi:hypothetical protein